MPSYTVKLHQNKVLDEYSSSRACRKQRTERAAVNRGAFVLARSLEDTSVRPGFYSGSKLCSARLAGSMQKRPSAIIAMVEERNGHDNPAVMSRCQQYRLPLASLPDGALGLLLSFGSVADLVAANMVSECLPGA